MALVRVPCPGTGLGLSLKGTEEAPLTTGMLCTGVGEQGD